MIYIVLQGISGCIFAIFLSACCLVDRPGNYRGLVLSDKLLTVDTINQNSQISRIEAFQHPGILAAYGGEYSDIVLERMVAKIVGNLVAVSGNPDQAYRIVILDSPNINAFSLPGGYLYVTRGLLALANDSAEIAAVIAHEMAHITANHGFLRRKKEEEVALVNQVVTEVLKDSSIKQEMIMRGKISLARFSREQELQADEIGIRMIANAGYDPFAASPFFADDGNI